MNAIYEKEMAPKSFLIGNLDSVQFSCFFVAASLDTMKYFRVFNINFQITSKIQLVLSTCWNGVVTSYSSKMYKTQKNCSRLNEHQEDGTFNVVHMPQ